MFPRSFRLAFPAYLICVPFFCAPIQASEPLNEKDSAEIITLASDFAKELSSAKLSNYTKYLDPASLENLADEYRRALSHPHGWSSTHRKAGNWTAGQS